MKIYETKQTPSDELLNRCVLFTESRNSIFNIVLFVLDLASSSDGSKNTWILKSTRVLN